MPIYAYHCPAGHESEHIGRYEDRETPRPCLTCGELAEYVIAPHHRQPDGIYSHEPNVGDPNDFERKHEAKKARER